MQLPKGSDVFVPLAVVERDHIMETYHRCNKDKTRTAKKLGIGRMTLYRKLAKYAIETYPCDALGQVVK